MLKHGEGGHFVTTASMGGLLPGVNAGIYTSTKIAAVGSNIHIVMPHDPEYAQLPGDGGSVPERVHVFPRRFVRSGKRWVPQT